MQATLLLKAPDFICAIVNESNFEDNHSKQLIFSTRSQIQLLQPIPIIVVVVAVMVVVFVYVIVVILVVVLDGDIVAVVNPET